jgi:DNA-binding beta-propeller fold protein YncE
VLRLPTPTRSDRRRSLLLATATATALLAAATPVQGAPFVYVTNASSGNVSQYDAAGGALAPLSPATVSTVHDNPLGVAVSPDGRSAYVTTSELYGTPETDAAVLQYSVGAGGSLTLQASAAMPPNADPGVLAASPDGRTLYVINGSGNGSVIQYSVGAGGALALKSPPTVPAPGPSRLAVSPDGRSVYVTTGVAGSYTVSQYTAAADGTLSPKSPAAVPTAEAPIGVTVSPDSRSVYIANNPGEFGASGVISQYTADANGALSPKSPPTVPTSREPFELAISPDAGSVYVTDSETAGSVLEHTVGAGGGVAPKSPPAVAAGAYPLGIAIT